MSASASSAPTGFGGFLTAFWGVGGVLLLLGQALWKLTPIALEAVELGMSGFEMAVCVAWVAFNGYAEGYRGFHRRFSPRVVARAQHLAANPTVLTVLLAPAFCMSLFRSTRKGLIVAWTLVVVIIGLVTLVRTLPQPWRGIVDAGVVVGLAGGALSILYFCVQALAGKSFDVDRQLPEPVEEAPQATAG